MNASTYATMLAKGLNKNHLPNARTKEFARRHLLLDRRLRLVHRSAHNGITPERTGQRLLQQMDQKTRNLPPLRRVNIVHRKNKKDDQCADGQTGIETRRREVIKPTPPLELPRAYHLLEDEPNDTPGEVVERRGRRDRAAAAQDDGRHGELERPRPLLRQVVENHGHGGADGEAYKQD